MGVLSMGEGGINSNELNLGTLDADYAIVGEVLGDSGRRTFLASRRSDGAEAWITVFASHGADDNNALSHFAADTKLLSAVRHPGVLRPIDGRWIGTNAFAVISDRPRGVTLRQSLASGERVSSPRVASILQELNGLLAWAREQGVVHRGVSLDAVFVEPMTERLQVTLLPTPISVDRVPDATADASTIGKLSWSLLAGRVLDSTDSKESLAALRPDLAQRVVDAVDNMRSAPGDVVHPDVGDFIATIAAADVLKVAELELEKQREEFAEMLRVHRETAAAELATCERRATELQERLAADRRTFEQEIERDRAALASDRAQLTAERAQLAYEVGSHQQRRASDQRGFGSPEASNGLVWPDVDRRAHPGRFLVPVLVTAALIVAAFMVRSAQLPRTSPSVVAVGTDTVVPTPPKVDVKRLPRGGFLSQATGTSPGASQTAAGSVSPTLVASVAAPAIPASPDSVMRLAAQRDSLARAAARRDSLARIDTAALRRARIARRDSLIRRDSSVLRDSLGFLRPDTLFQR
ncbi:MAG: hypothetical protein ABI442_13715 [Gemmatimonadaceae bacterium]